MPTKLQSKADDSASPPASLTRAVTKALQVRSNKNSNHEPMILMDVGEPNL